MIMGLTNKYSIDSKLTGGKDYTVSKKTEIFFAISSISRAMLAKFGLPFGK